MNHFCRFSFSAIVNSRDSIILTSESRGSTIVYSRQKERKFDKRNTLFKPFKGILKHLFRSIKCEELIIKISRTPLDSKGTTRQKSTLHVYYDTTILTTWFCLAVGWLQNLNLRHISSSFDFNVCKKC
jgi:hypothetical protein